MVGYSLLVVTMFVGSSGTKNRKQRKYPLAQFPLTNYGSETTILNMENLPDRILGVDDNTPLTFKFGKVFEGYSLWHAYNNPERRDAVARLYIPSWKQYRMNEKKNIYLRNST